MLTIGRSSFFSVVARCTTIFAAVTAVQARPTQPSAQLEQRAAALTNFNAYADAAINELQKSYNQSTGLWDGDWWNSANVITMLADYQGTFPNNVKQSTANVFDNTLAMAPTAYGFGGFLNGFYDDELWWALAWIRVYEVTGDQKFLDTASGIFEDAKAAWGTTPCSGLWWDKAHTSVNAIANTLYFTTASKLANLKPSTPAPYYYFNEAINSYTWIINSGMINGDNLLNDGLDLATCKNNNGPVFTYNQGVILSGLVELTWSTGNNLYNDIANVIATSAISNMTDKNGILHEPCEPSACDGDEQQFKGILGRNIQFLYSRGNDVSQSDKNTFYSFLVTNAKSIESSDDHQNQLGVDWSGVAGGPQGSSIQSQSSALDVIVSAAIITA